MDNPGYRVRSRVGNSDVGQETVGMVCAEGEAAWGDSGPETAKPDPSERTEAAAAGAAAAAAGSVEA